MKRRVAAILISLSKIMLISLPLVYVVYLVSFYWVTGATPQEIQKRSVIQKEQLERLKNNRKIWDGLHIQTYAMDIQYTGHMSAICYKAMIEVTDQTMTNLSGVNPANETFDPEICNATFKRFRVEELFALVEEFLVQDGPLRVGLEELEFDQDYGYITKMCIDKRTLPFDDESFDRNSGSYCIFSSNLRVKDQ